MKRLMRYALQLHHRRTSAFYLLPQSPDNALTSRDQLMLKHIAPPEDRPRTLRELFADTEYESEDDTQ